MIASQIQGHINNITGAWTQQWHHKLMDPTITSQIHGPNNDITDSWTQQWHHMSRDTIMTLWVQGPSDSIPDPGTQQWHNRCMNPAMTSHVQGPSNIIPDPGIQKWHHRSRDPTIHINVLLWCHILVLLRYFSVCNVMLWSQDEKGILIIWLHDVHMTFSFFKRNHTVYTLTLSQCS